MTSRSILRSTGRAKPWIHNLGAPWLDLILGQDPRPLSYAPCPIQVCSPSLAQDKTAVAQSIQPLYPKGFAHTFQTSWPRSTLAS